MRAACSRLRGPVPRGAAIRARCWRVVAGALAVSAALSAGFRLEAQAAGGAPSNPTSTQSAVQSAAQSAVQVGVQARPDTVTVGDPFIIIVRLRVPSSARVLWPTITDTAATIAPRAPMVRREGPATPAGREEFAEYPVAAWDTGQLTTGWPDVLVVVGADTVPVALADAGVYVRSVLSLDTLEHVPRPPKPPFGRVLPWWQQWWLALAVLAALLLLWYVLWRRRRLAYQPTTGAAPLSPYDHAMHAFDRLDRLELSEAGEFGRATTLTMEILRGYLAAVVPVTSRAHTSAELLVVMGDDPRVPIPSLIQLLVVTDAVKFARRELTLAETRSITQEARQLVEAVDEAVRSRLLAQRARLKATADGPDATVPNESRTASGVS